MSPLQARCRAAVAVATLAAAGALAAPAAAATSVAAGCPPKPMTQPFAPWQDQADYVLAPGGNIEESGRTWKLQGGAVAVKGNETFMVGAKTDRLSLSLPSGSSATTAPMCIGVEHRTMRFFAKSTRPASLTVDVLYADAKGVQRSIAIGKISGQVGWAPTPILPLIVNTMAPARGNAMIVSFRFRPTVGTAWSIDDVYVDPYRKT